MITEIKGSDRTLEAIMCEACKNLSKVWDASQELIVSHFVNAKTKQHNFILVQGNSNPQSVNIAVNFCPWCGRDLNKED